MMATVAMMGMVAILSTLFLVSDSVFTSYAIDDPNAVMVDDQHYVSLSVSNADLSFTPADGSLADSKQVGVTVSTNVPGGAKLYLSTADDTNALYKDGDTSGSSPAIQPTNRVTTLASMPVNTWGYSLDNTNFQAVPTSDSAALIADVDGSAVGTTSGDVISATVPVYYGAKVDSSLPAGTYSNRVVYSVIGTIPVNISSVAVSVGGENVENLQVGEANTIVVTTDLMTSELGTPRVYLTTTNPAGTVECGNVNVAKNSQGYMTITCVATPSAAATGVTLHITQGSSGDWKWGDFTVDLPNIVTPQHTMSEISTMQEMTPEFCASVTMESPGNTARLKDERDGKYYWVAKLADGNCWMTQNLDLDLSGRTLTPADSDVSSNWRFEGLWHKDAGLGSASSSAILGWNLGEYVKTSPTATTSCSAYVDLSECDSQFTKVTSGMTPYTEAVNEGKLPAENVAVSGNNYDAHYLVGNYYSWPAATAGSGNDIANSGDAADSICPANWRLPLSGGSNTENGSFSNLLSQYSLTSTPTSGNSNIATSPLYFVRGGYVYPNFSRLNLAGFIGYYWSSRAYSSSNAYSLYFSSSGVYPSGDYYRYYGRSVRCVAGWE